MRSLATELMRGAIDLHTHSHPEGGLDIPKRMEDWEWAAAAQELGMRALVLKSHLWPTMSAAYHLQHAFPDLPVFGSVTLNSCVGGVEPWVVEASARLGARVVFMPTWTAAHDLRIGSSSRTFKGWFPRLEELTPEKGIYLLDSEGRLLRRAAEVLEVAHALNLTVCTGHLSPEESIALAEEGKRIGFRRLVFAHPHVVGATFDQMRRMADLGAYVELCFLNLLPPRQLDPNQVVRELREIGAERCVMTSDYFREWCPPPPEMLRMFVGTLLQLGVGAEQIRTMIHTNPARLLGLKEVPGE